MLRTKSLRLGFAISVVIAIALVAFASARWWGDNYTAGSANQGGGATATAVQSIPATAGPTHSPSASSEATLATSGLPVGYVPSSACQQISFARASSGASARWTYTCRGLMTWEVWREGLRRTAVDLGWREVASQSEELEFVRDDLRVGMTIDPRPPDGAFALTQRVLRS